VIVNDAEEVGKPLPGLGSGSVSIRMSDKLQFVAGNDKLIKLIGHQTDPLPPGGRETTPSYALDPYLSTLFSHSV